MSKKATCLSLAIIVVSFCFINGGLFASQMDERIESSARQSYVFRTYLKDDAIKFQSKDGFVVLTGTVSEESHKSLAQETVTSLPGVKSVNNQLEIKGESPARDSDAWLITKVKTSLLFHRSVSGFATEVNVKDGVATLRGDTASQEQKDLTTEYAKDVDGIKDVKNEMTVAKKTPIKPDEKTMSEKIDDASITALAKGTLLYHRSTSGIGTEVETNDGVVTLRGKARNAAGKALATKYVSDVKGVKSVQNRMTIE